MAGPNILSLTGSKKKKKPVSSGGSVAASVKTAVGASGKKYSKKASAPLKPGKGVPGRP
tara:strand:+ start:509 stop:685 length:177 start_codon:yes stop_codon:yes gene_type:complete